MLSDRWERLLSIIACYGVTPILAVISINQDPALKLQDPDPYFWDRMRSFETAGTTIGCMAIATFVPVMAGPSSGIRDDQPSQLRPE